MSGSKITTNINVYIVLLTCTLFITLLGMYTGYNTLSLALVVPENGRVVVCEINEEYVKIGKPFFAEVNQSKTYKVCKVAFGCNWGDLFYSETSVLSSTVSVKSLLNKHLHNSQFQYWLLPVIARTASSVYKASRADAEMSIRLIADLDRLGDSTFGCWYLHKTSKVLHLHFFLSYK